MRVHPAQLPSDRLLKDCRVTQQKRSGPGGQRRNKVETAVRLRHRPSGIEVLASERRLATENHRLAVQRLRLRLAIELRSPQARNAPSPLWRQRTGQGRLSVSPQHEAFAALLAEALDRVFYAEGNLAEAARQLAVSGSQLVRLLSKEPAALQRVNRWRAEQGLRRLQAR
jgi:hypothetical protein